MLLKRSQMEKTRAIIGLWEDFYQSLVPPPDILPSPGSNHFMRFLPGFLQLYKGMIVHDLSSCEATENSRNGLYFDLYRPKSDC